MLRTSQLCECGIDEDSFDKLAKYIDEGKLQRMLKLFWVESMIKSWLLYSPHSYFGKEARLCDDGRRTFWTNINRLCL